MDSLFMLLFLSVYLLYKIAPDIVYKHNSKVEDEVVEKAIDEVVNKPLTIKLIDALNNPSTFNALLQEVDADMRAIFGDDYAYSITTPFAGHIATSRVHNVNSVILYILMAKRGYIPSRQSTDITVDMGVMSRKQIVSFCKVIEYYLREIKPDARLLFKPSQIGFQPPESFDYSRGVISGNFVWNFGIPPRLMRSYIRKYIDD